MVFAVVVIVSSTVVVVVIPSVVVVVLSVVLLELCLTFEADALEMIINPLLELTSAAITDILTTLLLEVSAIGACQIESVVAAALGLGSHRSDGSSVKFAPLISLLISHGPSR